MTTARNQAAPAVPVSSADPVGDVVAPLRGTVVEIGAGRGANVAVLHPSVRWIAVEPNLDRRRALRAAAERRGGGSRVIVGRAESLPLLDGCADAVLSTRVLCSVDDPEAALARAGFATVELRHHEQGRGLDPWRPHIAGHARRRTAEPSDHEVAR
ncbi:MAG TPA: methyltransferase domain-containing protein [Jiangellaceae bacterium]